MLRGQGRSSDDGALGQLVVDDVVLGGELGEEELGEVANPGLVVLEALGHAAELALGLDHLVEDEVGEDHEGVLADGQVLVEQAAVELVRLGVHDGRPADGDVAEGDDQVALDDRIGRLGHDGEQELEVVVAELRGHTHELGQRRDGGDHERGRLRSQLQYHRNADAPSRTSSARRRRRPSAQRW